MSSSTSCQVVHFVWIIYTVPSKMSSKSPKLKGTSHSHYVAIYYYFLQVHVHYFAHLSTDIAHYYVRTTLKFGSDKA